MAEQTAAAAVDQAEIVELLALAGVPARYRDCRFANFEPRAGSTGARRAAETVAAAERIEGNLTVLGGPGAGKTHLAVSMIAARAEQYLARWPQPVWEEGGEVRIRPSFGSRFRNLPALLDELRSRIGDPGRDDPLAGLMESPLLVLDDLGRERATDWAAERLYVLVDGRYSRRLPIVATSNLSLDELAEQGYEALVDRLVEDGPVIELRASSYRVARGRGDR